MNLWQTFLITDIFPALSGLSPTEQAILLAKFPDEEAIRTNAQKEETIQTYEHNEFLEQVIKQGQSKKSQGKRIAIIGELGAGKTTLLDAISLTACFTNAFSPQIPGFPIWISL